MVYFELGGFCFVRRWYDRYIWGGIGDQEPGSFVYIFGDLLHGGYMHRHMLPFESISDPIARRLMDLSAPVTEHYINRQRRFPFKSA